MSYILTCASILNDMAPAVRRADTPLDALRAFVAYMREDHVAPIQNDQGELIPPARLLKEAHAEAADAQSHRRLIAVMADYAEAAGLREMRSARERHGVLNSDEYEADLRLYEEQSGPAIWRREIDAEDRVRLRDILDHRSSWHLAGAAWFRDFHTLPPAEVVTQLRTGRPRSKAHELRVGAEEELRRHGGRPPRYQVVSSPDGPVCSVVDSDTGRVERRWVNHQIAQAHADALNTGRPWSERNYGRELDLWARVRVERRPVHQRTASGSASPQPASPTAPRRGSWRRP